MFVRQQTNGTSGSRVVHIGFEAVEGDEVERKRKRFDACDFRRRPP